MENKEEDEKEKGQKGRRILEGETWQAMSCSGSSDALATASVTNKASIVACFGCCFCFCFCS